MATCGHPSFPDIFNDNYKFQTKPENQLTLFVFSDLSGGFSNSVFYCMMDIIATMLEIISLINTSFKVRGKPIVDLASEALSQGREMGLDYVLIVPAGYKS